MFRNMLITWISHPLRHDLEVRLDCGYANMVGLIMLNDVSPSSKEHPESNSFSYIKQIILALNSLTQVHRAMDTLTQRLPLEVYQLVDKTIMEVESRHSIDLRGIKNKQREQRSVDGFMKSQADSEVLADLMWTLYSKLAAVLSGHRIVHDCVLAIVKESKNKEDLTDTPEFNYIEVWKPIQSEVF
jgi:exocyst complex component 4